MTTFHRQPFTFSPWIFSPWTFLPWIFSPWTLNLGSIHLVPFHLGSFHLGPFHLGPFHLGSFHLGSFHLGPFQLVPFHLGPFQLGPFHLGSFHLGPFHQTSMVCGWISATVLASQSVIHLERWMLLSSRFKPQQVVPKFKWNSAFGPSVLRNSSAAQIKKFRHPFKTETKVFFNMVSKLSFFVLMLKIKKEERHFHNTVSAKCNIYNRFLELH